MKVLFWVEVGSGPVALGLWALSALSPQLVETVYSRAIYPFFAAPWSRLIGAVPFAVAPVLLVSLVAAAAAAFFVWPPLRALSLVGTATSVLIAWFVLGWGLNYQRHSWAESHGWAVKGGSVTELESLATKLADHADIFRRSVGDRAWTSDAVRRAVTTAYSKAGTSDPLLAGTWGDPKPFPISAAMSWVGIAGIFIPFTAEPLVNQGPGDWQLPFTTAHEAAHLRGWAREDEANFLAFWVLRNDPDPALAYSAWSSALLYVANALRDEGPEGIAAWKRVSPRLSNEVRTDWNRSFAYWDKFKGPVSDAAGAVNDVYLKSQGQSEGVRSYGRMVDLLLAAEPLF